MARRRRRRKSSVARMALSIIELMLYFVSVAIEYILTGIFTIIYIIVRYILPIVPIYIAMCYMGSIMW